MAVLVIADHNNKSLADSVAKCVTAASRLGGEIDILVAGSGADSAAAEAAKIAGVRKVLHADDPAYAKLLAEPTAKLIVARAGAYEALVAPASANGKNIMPRVAALLDVAIFLTTQPLPHPTSRNKNGLSKEIVSKNFITFFPCSFSINSSLPFLAHLSKIAFIEFIILSSLLFNYNLRLTELYYEQVLRFTYIQIFK